MLRFVGGTALWIGLALASYAADPDRDFSGTWLLDPAGSRTSALGVTETSLNVSQSEAGILCSTGAAKWSYALDGSETRKRIGAESRSSIVKWEGTALLVNTIVSGPPDYTVMDRWQLSRDRNTLTITRQIVRANGEVEGVLVFRREGSGTAAAARPAEPPAPQGSSEPAGGTARPALAARPARGAEPDITVPMGTRVLLQLGGEVSTKRAKEGDRVYLRTAAPVAADGRVAIPTGSDVQGTITRTRPAGRVSGKKGELYIRFDSLMLPNGVSRDFRARPLGDEGQVEGRGKSADAGTVMAGAGMGATIGAITKGLPGAAVGGGIGALAGVLLSRDRNVTLPPGTHIEMILDRDLVFHPDEIPQNARFR
jgi:type IV secretion system protein VirB10